MWGVGFKHKVPTTMSPDTSSPAGNGAEAEQRSIDELQESLGPAFDIKKRLGKGSMATVYLAKEEALGRLVAIKVLSPGQARDETSRKRFEREAKAAASLAHPNVVQVYRFGRLNDETPYLVMRYVHGRTIEERLGGEGRLPLDLAKQVLSDVASALAAAHAKGIVHRDVRPANILWDEDGSEALLADFGIAALLATSGEEAARLTQTGQMMGNPKYLSPEQLLDQDLSEMADIYSLGVLGYELFTGEGPYEAKTNTQWITAHLNADPRDIQQLRPGIDPAIADLLRRCLNREPNHRPAAADIVRALEGQGDPTGPTSGSVEAPATFDQIAKRRVPQIVGFAMAVAVGLIGTVVGLADVERLPLWTVDVTLPLAVAGVAATTVVAWFHGERGKQQTNVLEWILLSLIGVLWITATVAMLIRG